MRLRRRPLCPMLPLAALLLLSCACASGGSARPVHSARPAVSGAAETDGILSCADFVAALSDTSQTSPFLEIMQEESSTYTNSDPQEGTGQTLRFLAVQPADSSSAEALVFFNGTSQITPDWPVAMLVQGSESLCDHSALVFSDYPGIGETPQPAAADFTFDNIANNVYHLLTDLNATGELDISSISPIGWSLGTEAALKFTALATWNADFRSTMKINHLFLIATKSGGDVYSVSETEPESCSETRAALGEAAPGNVGVYWSSTGSQAMCVTSVLDRLLALDTEEWDVAASLKGSLVGVMFPYVYASDPSQTQAPYGTGDPPTICAATVDTDDNQVSALCDLETDPEQSLETPCTASSESTCSTTLELYQANREERPYLDQISSAQFQGQRGLNFHYDYAFCQQASTTSWTSEDCEFNPYQTSNSSYNPALIYNGSPCTTIVSTYQGAPLTDCQGFYDNPTSVYIFNGEEDLFIRNDYGSALCAWFNQKKSGSCTLNTYQDTGHAVMYDYPDEIFAVIDAALSAAR